MLLMLLLSQVPEPLSGGAGWIGAGLLGAVLGWLCFVYLPAKDKFTKDLLAEHREERKSDAAECRAEREASLSAFREEREKDRTSRHDAASLFQTALNNAYTQTRQEGIENRKALEKQTQDLLAVLKMKE